MKCLISYNENLLTIEEAEDLDKIMSEVIEEKNKSITGITQDIDRVKSIIFIIYRK